LQGCGAGNVIDSNYMHDGSIGISLWSAPRTAIWDNEFNRFSSCGIYMNLELESLYVHNNDVDHCNLAFRIGSMCQLDDTNRSGYFYNNRCYNDSAAGSFLKFHSGGEDLTWPPGFWFYHNSYAGGSDWAAPIGVCGRLKFVNNIWSSEWLAKATDPVSDGTPDLFLGYDYNFLGGYYKEYRYYAWAGYDRHNQWSADTMYGDANHQVWPLGEEPDWIVPDTSTAYQSGLDLSDSFTLRDSTYGPLPGMTSGYFPGDKPNLGAVQGTGRVGMPKRDPGRGSVSQLPELAFAPNPATGRSVMVRCAIPTASVGKLTLRDVLGRTVKSVALVPSSIAPQLDLRSFAPGIYIAALDAGGQSVSRKLIISAH
jgi:hypothetical protein